MPKRWSKLRSRLYNLIEPTINFQIHCALYEMNSNHGYHTLKLPRYFITIDKEIIFDYPRDCDTTWKWEVNTYPWDTDISAISQLIENYVQCPQSELMNTFKDDRWGVTDIFRVCDRRIGKRRLYELRNTITNETLLKIIDKRLNDRNTCLK